DYSPQMIEKSNSTSLALATIAILGQPPSTPFRQNACMKSRLRLSCVVANPRHSYGYDCGLRLAWQANPSISFAS
ncbi:hypothetical protein, partial [Nitrosomonas sp. ANs5]|uniref:hypothetical protein n=1 Tax=Nitrosomonas sp. ANs5 TaxID=3423941 RepID=UPI003D3424F8